VSLTTGTATGGDAQGDTLSNIENLTGSNFNDTLEGTAGNNTLAAGAGIDTVSYEQRGGVTVSLAVTAAQNTVGAGTDTISASKILRDRVLRYSHGIVGSKYDPGPGWRRRADRRGGIDTLTGGGGNDKFVYTATADSDRRI